MHRGWGMAHPQYCMCKAKDARKLHSLSTMLFTTSVRRRQIVILQWSKQRWGAAAATQPYQ
jgi:hypothetical protein